MLTLAPVASTLIGRYLLFYMFIDCKVHEGKDIEYSLGKVGKIKMEFINK